jgi:hypothetical protein
MEHERREEDMRRTAFAVLAAFIVLAAAACQENPTGPKLGSVTSAKSVSSTDGKGSDTTFDSGDLMGTWQATKAEGWRMVRDDQGGFVEVAGSRRDLVAEGGTVSLVLQPTDQIVGRATPGGSYTITVTMPGAAQGLDTGFWFSGPAWQEKYKGLRQIDFYPARLLPDVEYGDVPAFLLTLSGNTLKLWDAGLSFLPYDFGWAYSETSLSFEFTRR